MAKGKYEKWLTDDGLLLLEGWARDGLTDEQIAHNCDINKATLYEWKKKYPDISDSLKKGKEIVDIEVENALLKRALGFQYDEVTQELNTDTQRLETTKVVKKMVVPDTTAQIFWLKNRRPDKYRDKPELPTDKKTDETNLFERLSEIAEKEDEAFDIPEVQSPPEDDNALVEESEV